MEKTGKAIWVINGPNLNMLGTREPSIYGMSSLSVIEEKCSKLTNAAGIDLSFKQSSYEGQLIDWVHEANVQANGLAINAGGYSHTSIALMDAITMLEIPVIDVHISNIYARETFRHTSYIASVATGIVAGLGENSYTLAVQALISLIQNKE